MNVRLGQMTNQYTSKRCITASGEDVVVSTNPEDNVITLNFASSLATIDSSQQVTHDLDTNDHHTPTHLPPPSSLIPSSKSSIESS